MKKFKEMNAVEKAEYLNERFWVIDGRLYHRELDHHRKTPGPVGSNCNGYLIVGVDGSLQRVHRCIYAMHHGYWPENGIDHVNGIKDDNRIGNLQEVSPSCNTTKADWPAGDSTFRGVTKAGNKWLAQINNSKGKRIWGKCRPTKRQALLDWVDMMEEKMGREACQTPQLSKWFDIADKYKRTHGDQRVGSWRDKRLPAERQSNVDGVYWNKATRKWVVYLKVNGNRVSFGTYINEEDAIEAVKKVAI